MDTFERGDVVLHHGEPVTFISYHTEQARPGRYYTRALVRDASGREMSVKVGTLSSPDDSEEETET